jgi:hypothetical protein
MLLMKVFTSQSLFSSLSCTRRTRYTIIILGHFTRATAYSLLGDSYSHRFEMTSKDVPYQIFTEIANAGKNVAGKRRFN